MDRLLAFRRTHVWQMTLRGSYRVGVTSLFARSENYAVTLLVPGDRPDKRGSAGSARGASELRIMDDDDRLLGPGEVGEIQVRPLQPGTMMKGYYKMPEQTAQAFRDGWFCTGDRGYRDALKEESGRLYPAKGSAGPGGAPMDEGPSADGSSEELVEADAASEGSAGEMGEDSEAGAPAEEGELVEQYEPIQVAPQRRRRRRRGRDEPTVKEIDVAFAQVRRHLGNHITVDLRRMPHPPGPAVQATLR